MNKVALLFTLLCAFSQPTPAKYNYAEVLHKSFLFYHAQRSGNLTNHRRLAWRTDSCFNCKGLNGEDLSGGYYEAANTMKWGLPLTFTIYQLAWNVVEFKDAFLSVNELEEAMDAIKWGTDYLIAAHPSKFLFYGQLGDSKIDFRYFGPPEEYELWALGPKPAFALTPQDPGTEIVAQASAALAAASVAWKPYHSAYSQLCLQHAQDLFEFATTYQLSTMNSTQSGFQVFIFPPKLTFQDHNEWYPSLNGYKDELVLAAIWLYKATSNTTYLQFAESQFSVNDPGYEYSWDEKIPAISILLAQVTNKPIYHGLATSFFSNWLPVPHTPLGLAYRFHWGSLRYSANVAFLAFVYNKMVPNTQLEEYAISQINYMLGDCGRSWVVGFGSQSPLRPYHKSSYNSFLQYPTRGQPEDNQMNDFLYSANVNRFILYGALVGGPFQNDSWVDSRWDYEWTEVTQDYNAGFTGAVAALVAKYGGVPFTDDSLDLGWNNPGAGPKPLYTTMFSQMTKIVTSSTSGTTSTSGIENSTVSTSTSGKVNSTSSTSTIGSTTGTTSIGSSTVSTASTTTISTSSTTISRTTTTSTTSITTSGGSTTSLQTTSNSGSVPSLSTTTTTSSTISSTSSSTKDPIISIDNASSTASSFTITLTFFILFISFL